MSVSGRLGRDAVVRHTKRGRFVANFSVAVDESYKDLLGEWQKKTAWHRVQVWEGLAETVSAGLRTTGLKQAQSHADYPNTWIFQASPKFSGVKGALRSIEGPVCLVRQFSKEIKPGDRVYLWECGPGGGIIGVAEVSEAPRIQVEPPEQLPFIRESEKFAGDRLRVKLQILKRISPVISREYLLSRPELTSLTIFRAPRGTNFRVSRDQAAVLQKVVEQFTGFFPNGNGSGEKRIVFAQG